MAYELTFTASQIDYILERYAAGSGLSEISRTFNVSRHAIKHQLQKRGITIESGRRNKDNAGIFKKGLTPWNKGGAYYSPETREKMAAAKRGKPSTMKGKNHTEEAKEKNRLAHLGKPAWNKGIEHVAVKGEKNPNWRGGTTPKLHLLRASLSYKAWRKAVLERDDYTCIECGSTENLEADHIQPFVHYPELRMVVDNGRTLCHDCHLQIGWNCFRDDNPRKRIAA